MKNYEDETDLYIAMGLLKEVDEEPLQEDIDSDEYSDDLHMIPQSDILIC